MQHDSPTAWTQYFTHDSSNGFMVNKNDLEQALPHVAGLLLDPDTEPCAIQSYVQAWFASVAQHPKTQEDHIRSWFMMLSDDSWDHNLDLYHVAILREQMIAQLLQHRDTLANVIPRIAYQCLSRSDTWPEENSQKPLCHYYLQLSDVQQQQFFAPNTFGYFAVRGLHLLIKLVHTNATCENDRQRGLRNMLASDTYMLPEILSDILDRYYAPNSDKARNLFALYCTMFDPKTQLLELKHTIYESLKQESNMSDDWGITP